MPKRKVYLVFIHEDRFGPTWAHFQKAFSSKKKMDAYLESEEADKILNKWKTGPWTKDVYSYMTMVKEIL